MSHKHNKIEEQGHGDQGDREVHQSRVQVGKRGQFKEDIHDPVDISDLSGHMV